MLQVLLLPHAPAATHDPPTGAADTSSAGGMVLLERWVLAHERAAVLDFGSPSSPAQLPRRPSLFESARSLEVPVIYKRTVIMLRSLYALLRTLPAHRLFLACKARPRGSVLTCKMLRCSPPLLGLSALRCAAPTTQNNVACPFSLVYTISASPTPAPLGLDADNCGRFDFTPVQTPAGVLTASAAYLSHAVRRSRLRAWLRAAKCAQPDACVVCAPPDGAGGCECAGRVCRRRRLAGHAAWRAGSVARHLP
jgi:hypothetical protein